jgi:hypothetical protein
MSAATAAMIDAPATVLLRHAEKLGIEISQMRSLSIKIGQTGDRFVAIAAGAPRSITGSDPVLQDWLSQISAGLPDVTLQALSLTVTKSTLRGEVGRPIDISTFADLAVILVENAQAVDGTFDDAIRFSVSNGSWIAGVRQTKWIRRWFEKNREWTAGIAELSFIVAVEKPVSGHDLLALVGRAQEARENLALAIATPLAL